MTGSKSEGLSPRTERLDHCPVCGNAETKHMFSAPDRLHSVPGEFSYHVCGSCDSVFQNPMVIPEDLHLCYPSEYSPYNVRPEIPDIDLANLHNHDFKSSLRKAIVDSVRGQNTDGLPGRLGNLLSRFAFFRERAFYGLVIDDCLPRGGGENFALDLGCGSGWLMQKLAKVGWQTEGLEWNEAAADRARNLSGLKVWAGDFQKVNLPKNHYDLIVLNHVFEHFAEPREVLRRVWELLTPGGKAVLFYPNPHALGSSWYKTFWFAWEVPRHLVLPTPRSLQRLAEQIGFRKTKIKTRAYYPEELWTSSAAFTRGMNPDNERPPLAFSERFGVYCERFLNGIGFEKGWEVVAVLTK